VSPSPFIPKSDSTARAFVPSPGASPAEINRDAELARLKRLLSDQLQQRAYSQARETLEVLMHLHPRDPDVQTARDFLAQQL
jgi:hypothetical protein